MKDLTFLDSKRISEDHIPSNSFVVVGIPSETGCAGKLGTIDGPKAIRESSLDYSWPEWNGFYEPKYDRHVLMNSTIVDLGNIKESLSGKNFYDTITKTIKEIIRNKSVPVVLGGDHSIAHPIIKAFSYPLQVVQFDAHSDYQREEETDASSSGTVMRRVAELQNVSTLFQLGMRGYLNSGTGFSDSKNNGNTIITRDEIRNFPPGKLLKGLKKTLPVYLTIDTDVFDPSICPGTTVPEPDGLLYSEIVMTSPENTEPLA